MPDVTPGRFLDLEPPLRLLVVTANSEGALVPLDKERTELIQALSLVADCVDLETIDGHGTLRQMRERLTRGNFDAVILVAHGDLGSGTGHGFVLLEGEQGRSQRVDGRFLRSLFNDISSLQLVVLSVCHSGRSSAPLANKLDENEESVARLIIKDGLPAVVAMQSRIGLQANRYFLQALVDVLGRGGSLDEAVQQERKAIYERGQDPINWSVPALYLQTEFPESLPWYARLADSVADWFWTPKATATITGTLAIALIWTLINLVVGIGETRPWPPISLPAGQGWALLAWLLLSPGLIAALHRTRHPRVRNLGWKFQWIYKLQGVSVGMIVGTAIVLSVFSLVYYSPLWPLLSEPLLKLFLALGLGWMALMGYAQVRAIPRVMTVNAHVRSPRLEWGDLAVILGWPMFLLALIFLGLLLSDIWPVHAWGSMILAILLLALLVALRRGEHRDRARGIPQ